MIFSSLAIRVRFFPFRKRFFAHSNYYSRSICMRCMYIFFRVERFTICLYSKLILWRDKGKDEIKRTSCKFIQQMRCSFLGSLSLSLPARLLVLNHPFLFQSVVKTHASVQLIILLQLSPKRKQDLPNSK